MSLSSQKFLNTIYTWAVKRIDPQKREQWEYEMDLPLPWEVRRGALVATPEEAEDEINDFIALMNKQH